MCDQSAWGWVGGVGKAGWYGVPLLSYTNYPVIPSTDYALGNRVWHDVDGDNVQDSGEVGIGGATVTVTEVRSPLVPLGSLPRTA